jgi:hypothetical protein
MHHIPALFFGVFFPLLVALYFAFCGRRSGGCCCGHGSCNDKDKNAPAGKEKA